MITKKIIELYSTPSTDDVIIEDVNVLDLLLGGWTIIGVSSEKTTDERGETYSIGIVMYLKNLNGENLAISFSPYQKEKFIDTQISLYRPEAAE